MTFLWTLYIKIECSSYPPPLPPYSPWWTLTSSKISLQSPLCSQHHPSIQILVCLSSCVVKHFLLDMQVSTWAFTNKPHLDTIQLCMISHSSLLQVNIFLKMCHLCTPRAFSFDKFRDQVSSRARVLYFSNFL